MEDQSRSSRRASNINNKTVPLAASAVALLWYPASVAISKARQKPPLPYEPTAKIHQGPRRPEALIFLLLAKKHPVTVCLSHLAFQLIAREVPCPHPGASLLTKLEEE